MTYSPRKLNLLVDIVTIVVAVLGVIVGLIVAGTAIEYHHPRLVLLAGVFAGLCYCVVWIHIDQVSRHAALDPSEATGP